jgi:hypothetical protein
MSERTPSSVREETAVPSLPSASAVAAKFVVEPANHLTCGMPRLSSRTDSGGVTSRSKKSVIDSQNSLSSVVDHRHNAR